MHGVTVQTYFTPIPSGDAVCCAVVLLCCAVVLPRLVGHRVGPA
jgi:hypothetical protein